MDNSLSLLLRQYLAAALPLYAPAELRRAEERLQERLDEVLPVGREHPRDVRVYHMRLQAEFWSRISRAHRAVDERVEDIMEAIPPTKRVKQGVDPK